jgi:anti-anti-sigma factor
MSVTAAEPLTSHLALSPQLVSDLAGGRSMLRAVAERVDSATVIRAGGEVDAYNEDFWQRLISEAAAVVPPLGLLVVDVSGLDFVGCCAFQVLAREADRCRARGVEIRLVSRQQTVIRAVKACGFAGILPIHPDVDSALDPTV